MKKVFVIYKIVIKTVKTKGEYGDYFSESIKVLESDSDGFETLDEAEKELSDILKPDEYGNNWYRNNTYTIITEYRS